MTAANGASEPVRAVPPRVFVVDGQPIYRRGLAACIGAIAEATVVGDADAVESAREDPRLAEATVLIVDHELLGARELIREQRGRGVAVIACVRGDGDGAMLASIEAGARGLLCKQALTPDALAVAIRDCADGAGAIAPELVGELCDGVSGAGRATGGSNGASSSLLTAREKRVLRLIADGHETREVSGQLHYSERTIKNVVHDINTKLDARNRTAAVARAVREGMI